jgi:hypothetical protein
MIDYVAVMNAPQQQLEEALHGRCGITFNSTSNSALTA